MRARIVELEGKLAKTQWELNREMWEAIHGPKAPPGSIEKMLEDWKRELDSHDDNSPEK